MTDFRALCAELLEAANTLLGQGESPANPGERLILTVHLENLEDCANRARAALSEQPSLKKQALADLDTIQTHDPYGYQIVDLSNIRRALEALPND
jgi:hypothetical protein